MVFDVARGSNASHHFLVHSPYRSSPVTLQASQSSPTQWPPVQSPCGEVVHSPVSGSAKFGKPSVTRCAVSSMRSSILRLASVHSESAALLMRGAPPIACVPLTLPAPHFRRYGPRTQP